MPEREDGCEVSITFNGEPMPPDEMGPAHSLMLGMGMAVQRCAERGMMSYGAETGFGDMCEAGALENLEVDGQICTFTTNLPTTWASSFLHANDLLLPVGTALQRAEIFSEQFPDGVEIAAVERLKVTENLKTQAKIRMSLSPLEKTEDDKLEIRLRTRCGKIVYVYGSQDKDSPLSQHSPCSQNPYLQFHTGTIRRSMHTTQESNGTEWFCPIPRISLPGHEVDHPSRDMNTMLEILNVLMQQVGLNLAPPNAARGALVGVYKNCEIIDLNGLRNEDSCVKITLKKSLKGGQDGDGDPVFSTVFVFEIINSRQETLARGEGIGGFNHPLVIKKNRFPDQD